MRLYELKALIEEKGITDVAIWPLHVQQDIPRAVAAFNAGDALCPLGLTRAQVIDIKHVWIEKRQLHGCCGDNPEITVTHKNGVLVRIAADDLPDGWKVKGKKVTREHKQRPRDKAKRVEVKHATGDNGDVLLVTTYKAVLTPWADYAKMAEKREREEREYTEREERLEAARQQVLAGITDKKTLDGAKGYYLSIYAYDENDRPIYETGRVRGWQTRVVEREQGYIDVPLERVEALNELVAYLRGADPAALTKVGL